MDKMTKKQRSFTMSRIRRRDTSPEILLRKALWRSGMRGYRLDYKVIGRPDIYYPSKKIAVFVDGCFWHKCPVCFKWPKSNILYWKRKIKGNKWRDKRANRELRRAGVTVVRIWEHELQNDGRRCIVKVQKIYAKKSI